MADEIIGETISGWIPSFSAGGVASVMMWVGIALVLGAGAILIFWVVFNRFKFNKKISLFRKVGNEVSRVLEDKGMFQRIGTAGDSWFVTKKSKKILPRPRKQIGKNEYWFYEGEDGEWRNFSLKDFDEELRKSGAYFVDEDMRLQRLGIQKNLLERFKKVTFWDKYGATIVNLIFMIIVVVLLVVLFQKMQGNWEVGTAMASAVRDMAKEVTNMRTQFGSGMVPIAESFLSLVVGGQYG